MRDKIIAKRYGDAYIEYAKPKIGLQQCVDEVKHFRWLVKEAPQLEQLLKAPEVSRVDKFRVLDHTLTQSYSKEFVNFIKYLIEKSRFDKFAAIADHIRLFYSHAEGIEATLRTTFPLELDVIERIKAKMEARFTKKVNLYLELNPDLLGGVQIVVGNTIIDGSVRHKLDALRKQLMKTQVMR